MTRTVAVGDPGEPARADHAAVVAAQSAARDAVRAGVSAGAVDRVARDALDERGLADLFTHGTGHGVGLDIHEPPILRAGAADILGESFTVTVEPGVYRAGVSGVRIEDLVLVGPHGAESLTRLPRDLVVL
jgi:Xaa-Pro aminopeptidase